MTAVWLFRLLVAAGGLLLALDGVAGIFRCMAGTGRAYRSSAPPRGVDARLLRAMIPVGRGDWRLLGVIATATTGLLFSLAGVETVQAFLAALSCVRGGGGLLLWIRRGSLRRVSATAAPLLSRCLAVELAGGCGLATALRRATDAAPDNAVVHAMLQGAVARLDAGLAAAAALEGAAEAELRADPRAGEDLRPVIAVVRLVDRGGAATSGMLGRLADGLDADARSRRRAAAAATEARFVAAALPVLTATMFVVITTISPRATAVAMSAFGLLVCGSAFVVALAGAAAVMLATRT